MGNWKSTVSWLMVGLLLLVTSGVSLAQEPGDTTPEEPEDTGAVITEFAGVPWGAGETTVREKHGEPWGESLKDTSHPGGPWKLLVYSSKTFGMKAMYVFGLQGDSGLVHGLVWIKDFRPDRCQAAYEKVRDGVQKRYPTLEAESHSYNKSPYLQFCRAVRVDQAAWTTRWADPVNGVTVELTINDHASMTLHFATPEYARFQGEGSSP